MSGMSSLCPFPMAHQNMAVSKELRVWVSSAIPHPLLVQTQPVSSLALSDCSSESRPIKGASLPPSLDTPPPQAERSIQNTVLSGRCLGGVLGLFYCLGGGVWERLLLS